MFDSLQAVNAVRHGPFKTLNALGIAQAPRGGPSKNVMPELRRTRRVAQERRDAVMNQRVALAQVKVDPTHLVGALQRQQMRSYLRTLDDGERMNLRSTAPIIRWRWLLLSPDGRRMFVLESLFADASMYEWHAV